MRTATACFAAVLLALTLAPSAARAGEKGKGDKDDKGGKASSPHEEVVRDMLGTLTDILKVLATVQDEATANAARPELKKAATRLQEQRKRAARLGPPGKEEKQRLEKAYQGKFDDTLKRLRAETIRVRAVPGGAEAVQEIAVITEKKKPK